MKTKTSPRKRLREWRRKTGTSATALAYVLKCHRSFIYELEMDYSGDNTLPGLVLAAAIEKETKIPARAWDRLKVVNHHRPARKGAA
jgi:hypothetical protein